MLNRSIFREYDIRGVVGQDLTAAFVEALGAAFAGYLADAGHPGGRIVMGRDGRLSSPELSRSLAAGMVSAGARVIDVGMGPTPALYFAAHEFQADAGIMITGSHNPPDYNGFKMVMGGRSFFGAQIQALYQRMAAGREAERSGGTLETRPVLESYLARITRDFRPGRPLKVVLDCGNGAAGAVAPDLLQRLPGISGEVLFPEVDGHFPNHHPDPTIPENLVDLRRRMLETGAELGIAFDGDGDRIGALDEAGRIVWGDRLMILFARQLLAERPGAMVLGDVKCSQLLFDAVAQAGGQPLMWKTGHSLIKDKMKETGAPLAGEMSGHLFFADRYLGFDDALYAAVRLMELVAGASTPLSARLSGLPEVHATPELRIDCADDRKFQVMERVRTRLRESGADLSEVDGVRVRLPDGWWLLRVSNTQPALVARVEAQSAARRDAVAAELAALLAGEGVVFPSWSAA
ncbi:MAG: phosphomannomutase/phosphoglucomutase [Magnetococcus sp. WYHC-3]